MPGIRLAPRDKCIAFDKLDGSNLRWEYQRKKGWVKSGSRKLLFDESHEMLGSAISIFHDTLATQVSDIIKKKFREAGKVTVFTEFVGENSFAGSHHPEDEKELVLFDVWIDRKGFVPPREFLKLFGHLNVPRVVYDGNLNQEFIDRVRDNEFDLKEGVVCKGGTSLRDMWMAKIKTLEYLASLKKLYGSDWENYWE